MEFKQDATFELTPEREKAIDEYLGYQEKLKDLSEQALLTWFPIFYLDEEKEELDIDKCTEEQCKELDSFDGKTSKNAQKKKEEFVKTLPHKTEKYYKLAYKIAPYHIGDHLIGQDTCIDHLDIEVIKEINNRIKIKLDTYKKYLTK